MLNKARASARALSVVEQRKKKKMENRKRKIYRNGPNEQKNRAKNDSVGPSERNNQQNHNNHQRLLNSDNIQRRRDGGKNDKNAKAVPNGDRPKPIQNVRREAHPIGFRTLENVLTINNEAEMIHKLASEMNGFLLLLDQPKIRTDFMCLILSALAKASELSTEQETVQMLVHFYMKLVPKLSSDANFYRELKLYISDLSIHFTAYTTHRQKHIEAVQNLLIFLRRMQLTIYQKSFDAVRKLTQHITAQIEYINRKGNSLNEFIVDILTQLNESADNFEQMREETEQTEVLLEPPQDFRKISIYPEPFDISATHEPFIRKNVVHGKYVAGVDHYLDVQFRLLREDFIRPLRDGITEYRHMRDNPQPKAANRFRIKDVNVYSNVQIIGSKMLHNEQVHSCRFDSTPFRNMRWQVSADLLFGRHLQD